MIVPPSRLAALRDQVKPRLLSDMNSVDAERVWFISPLEAKGLEYDAVVVVEPDKIIEEGPGGVRLLYVALTRPTQRLVTLDVGESAGAWREFLTSPATG